MELCKLPIQVYVQYATTLLRENAMVWWRNHMHTCRVSGRTPISTWDAFKFALEQQFKPINTTILARDKLRVYIQTKSVQQYIREFQTILLDIPDMSELERFYHFLQGLKPGLRQ